MEPQNDPLLDRFWHLGAEEVIKKLSCGQNGLDDAEAAQRLKEYGPNTLKANTRSNAIILFLSQFKSPVTILLIIAAGLSIGLGDLTDAIIIFIIVIISGLGAVWLMIVDSGIK